MARSRTLGTAINVETTDLPDGSICRVSWYTAYSVLIDRLVDGEVVWGQAFGGVDSVAHSITRGRAHMLADPATFDRRLLLDKHGRAVR